MIFIKLNVLINDGFILCLNYIYYIPYPIKIFKINTINAYYIGLPFMCIISNLKNTFVISKPYF